mgnify:CR=1 FL=1
MSDPFGRIQRQHYTFDWKAVATALVRMQALHQGIWRVGFRFDLRAAIVNMHNQQVPAAFLPIIETNLHKVDVLDDLSVDAAEVNPESQIIVPASVTVQ